ncbi:hypothetical protein KIF59_09575 [Enterobacter cloacae subsp. cloacae]|nr:hypothetical protein [Enterobacter cloacae subsp. cloacae]
MPRESVSAWVVTLSPNSLIIIGVVITPCHHRAGQTWPASGKIPADAHRPAEASQTADSEPARRILRRLDALHKISS